MFLIIESSFFLPYSFQNTEDFIDELFGGGSSTLPFIWRVSYDLGGLKTIVSCLLPLSLSYLSEIDGLLIFQVFTLLKSISLTARGRSSKRFSSSLLISNNCFCKLSCGWLICWFFNGLFNNCEEGFIFFSTLFFFQATFFWLFLFSSWL